MGLLIACVFQLRVTKKAFQFKEMLYLSTIFELDGWQYSINQGDKAACQPAICKPDVALCAY